MTDSDRPATAIERIAAWSRGPARFSPLARARAGHAVMDTVGCILAGAGDQATHAVRRAFAAETGAQGRATLVGGGRTAPGIAALANATAAHALDFDDSFRPLLGHASAVLVPALLALGEATGADGRTLIEAYLVGLEAQAVIGTGVNPEHYARGWHATATVGCIGAAAGTAWLLGQDAAGITRSMSLAASMAAGIKGQFGTPAKPLHAGLAARNAVEAALLGGAGMTGRPDILEHRWGFEGLYARPGGADWTAILARIGAPHAIEAVGLSPKRHPCCASTHNTLDMVLDLKATHGFTTEDVIEVDTLVGSINRDNLRYHDPMDEMQARFSMNYCVALALTRDRLRIADFTPARVADPALRRLLPRLRMRAYAPEEENGSAFLPHRVTIRLGDGRRLEAVRDIEKGTIGDPFDDADRWHKFADCCDGRLPAGDARDLHDRLGDLAAQPDLRFVATALAAARQKGPTP